MKNTKKSTVVKELKSNLSLRPWLHEGGGPYVGEVICLAMVKK